MMPVTPRPEMGIMFHRQQDPATLMAYARRVEQMGFAHLWVVEDCFYLGGIAQAAIALAGTSRLKVGMGINPGVARNAAFLAMEYATLAQAFPGRFIGGIGHGVAGWMEQVGARPASWLTSIEEITTAVRRILRGERVDVDGEYVRLSGVHLESAPNPVPPVLLGVRGEKSLRIAGACADGVVLASFSGTDYVRWAKVQVSAGWADAGREGAGLVVVNAACDVDDAAPADARNRIRGRIGTDERSRPRARHRADAFRGGDGGHDLARRPGRLVAGMPDTWLHELAITGTVEDARVTVSRLVDAGADAVVLVPPEDADWDTWLEAQAWAVATTG